MDESCGVLGSLDTRELVVELGVVSWELVGEPLRTPNERRNLLTLVIVAVGGTRHWQAQVDQCQWY